MNGELSSMEFVQKSLGLNLFFMRTMKEHAFILETGIAPKNADLVKAAGEFNYRFNELLKETVKLADGNVSGALLDSQQIVTDRTLPAEETTESLAGVPIDMALTKKEMMLRAGSEDPGLADRVRHLNAQAIHLTQALIEFKTQVLNGVLNCTLFTFVLPAMIEHLREEAQHYVEYLERVQQGKDPYPSKDLMEAKQFWDHIMAQHAQFVAHLMDPTETGLIRQADRLAARFFWLGRKAEQLGMVKGRSNRHMKALIQEETKAVREIRDFKKTGLDLILDCKAKSIIIPVLGDHILREANYFLDLLTNR